MGNCCSKSVSSDSGRLRQIDSLHPSPPMDSIESIGEMLEKIGSVEQTDPLISNTLSQAGASSSERGENFRFFSATKEVFLSHTGKQKNFVRQLHQDLTREHVSCFFDEDEECLPFCHEFPRLIFKAAATCKVAVVVLSKEFVLSKWPMLELSAFVRAIESGKNGNLKLLPIFFKITPYELCITENSPEWEMSKVSNDAKSEWQDVLKTVRKINGLILDEGGNEVHCRGTIVKHVRLLLERITPLQLLNTGIDRAQSQAAESEIREEKRQDTATATLTDNEIITLKIYCNDCYLTGEGGFGKVYRGNFRGSDVAIKKMEHSSDDSRASVEKEIRLLQGKHHKNIVSLITWRIEERESYLVYEYVSGCTLQAYLRENCPRACLGWMQCLKIIQGIAKGIQFLHSNKIIHVDIKPQNIMLDIPDEVKIIDFGISRHVNWEGTHRSTENTVGTKGYWAPEYCHNGKLSYKHDVYSFGIVVLEVITGQKHVDSDRLSGHFHIPEFMKDMMPNNRYEDLMDKRIKHDGWDRRDVRSSKAVAKLALRCADKDKKKRPDMDSVVRSLNSVAIDNGGEGTYRCMPM